MNASTTAMPDKPCEPEAQKPATVREVRLEDLLQGDRELLIRHGPELYRLRITKNGRLLLTK